MKKSKKKRTIILLGKTDLEGLLEKVLKRIGKNLIEEAVNRVAQEKDMPTYLSRKKTLQMLDCTPPHLLKLEKEELLKPMRSGRKVLFRLEDIQSYIESTISSDEQD